jgi:hypothetical protein
MPSAVAEPLPDGKYETDRAGAVTVVGAGADHSIDGAVNGTRLPIVFSL